MSIKKFAMVANSTVFTIIELHNDNNENPNAEKMNTALSSDPKVIALPENSEVAVGWSWDGNTFSNPE